MVYLCDSQLYREANITEREFLSTFGQSPYLTLHVKTVQCLWSFLHICEYFMIDRPPFDDVEPYKKLLCTIEYSSVPEHLRNIFSHLCVAFHGDLATVLKKGNGYVIEWVHQHRIPFEPRWYTWMITGSVTDTIEKMDMLYHLGIDPPSCSLEVALHKKELRIIDWLLHHKVPLISYHVSVAIRQDFPLDFIETLIVHYHCPVHSYSVASACSYGRLDIVKWWHRHNLPFCTYAPAWAALFGKSVILRFLVEKNKPLDRAWTRKNAHKSKNSETIHLASVI